MAKKKSKYTGSPLDKTRKSKRSGYRFKTDDLLHSKSKAKQELGKKLYYRTPTASDYKDPSLASRIYYENRFDKTHSDDNLRVRLADGGKVSEIQKELNEHKEDCLEMYPSGKMVLVNGLYGIEVNGVLKHTKYIGNEYYEIDGVVYKDDKKTKLKLADGGKVGKYITDINLLSDFNKDEVVEGGYYIGVETKTVDSRWDKEYPSGKIIGYKEKGKNKDLIIVTDRNLDDSYQLPTGGAISYIVPVLAEGGVICNDQYCYKIKKTLISEIQGGDTVMHNGEITTVSGGDIKHGTFMGSTLFGDSYKSGRTLVDKVIFVKKDNVLADGGSVGINAYVGSGDVVEIKGKEGAYHVVGVHNDDVTVKKIGEMVNKPAYSVSRHDCKIIQKGDSPLTYMGNPYEEVVIEKSGVETGSIPPTYRLTNATTYSMVDMFFSSPEEAKKYADKKQLIIVESFYNEYADGGAVDTQIASTIIQQLGGAGRLNAMTGAYNFVALPNGVSFKLKNPSANYVKVTLTSMDLYNLEVGRIRGGKYVIVTEKLGLYDDMLKPAIEKATGMYLSLAAGGKVKSIKFGDNVHVTSLNKTGIVYGVNGDRLTVKFIDGEQTVDIKDAEKVREMKRGGNVGGMVVTKISDIPNIEEKVDAGKVTYRGMGMGKKFDDFWKVAGQNGYSIKVDGKEYNITDTDFTELGGIKKIRFNAPYRKFKKGGDVSLDFEVSKATLLNWAEGINDENLLSWCGFSSKEEFETASGLPYSKKALVESNTEDLEYVYNRPEEYAIFKNGGEVKFDDIITNIAIGTKVKIVNNLDDHKGYKGEELEVIAADDENYYVVENAKGKQWYAGEEELEVIKAFADGGVVTGRNNSEGKKFSVTSIKRSDEYFQGGINVYITTEYDRYGGNRIIYYIVQFKEQPSGKILPMELLEYRDKDNTSGSGTTLTSGDSLEVNLLNETFSQGFVKKVLEAVKEFAAKDLVTFADGGRAGDETWVNGYDAYVKDIWENSTGYSSKEKVVADLKELQEMLAGVHAGTVRPSKVIGTGYKQHLVKKLAITYLENQIKERKADVASEGRTISTNVSNFNYHIQKAKREGIIDEKTFNDLLESQNESVKDFLNSRGQELSVGSDVEFAEGGEIENNKEVVEIGYKSNSGTAEGGIHYLYSLLDDKNTFILTAPVEVQTGWDDDWSDKLNDYSYNGKRDYNIIFPKGSVVRVGENEGDWNSIVWISNHLVYDKSVRVMAKRSTLQDLKNSIEGIPTGKLYLDRQDAIKFLKDNVELIDYNVLLNTSFLRNKIVDKELKYDNDKGFVDSKGKLASKKLINSKILEHGSNYNDIKSFIGLTPQYKVEYYDVAGVIYVEKHEKMANGGGVDYKDAIFEFNKELIEHPSVIKASEYYKKTPEEIVKALQVRLSTKGNRIGKTKEVYIDLTDKDSGIVIKHKKKYANGGTAGMGKSKEVIEAENKLRKAKKTGISSFIDEASRNLDKVYENELTGEREGERRAGMDEYKEGGAVSEYNGVEDGFSWTVKVIPSSESKKNGYVTLVADIKMRNGDNLQADVYGRYFYEYPNDTIGFKEHKFKKEEFLDKLKASVRYKYANNAERKQMANDGINVFSLTKNKYKEGGKLKANDIPLNTWLQHKRTGTKVKVWNVDPTLGKMQLEDEFGNKDKTWRDAGDWKIIATPKEHRGTAHKYKLGDKYRGDFDYDGMLDMGVKAEVNWGIIKLTKLHTSFEDVNYYKQASFLWIAIEALRENNIPVAEAAIKDLHKSIDEEFPVEFESGGSVVTIEEEDIREAKKLIKAFSETMAGKSCFTEADLLENLVPKEFLGYGAWSFNSVGLKSSIKKSDVQVGGGVPNMLHLVLDTGINTSGVGDNHEPKVARTYSIMLEIKGLKRISPRKFNEGVLLKFYSYSRTIQGIIEQFAAWCRDDFAYYSENADLEFGDVVKGNKMKEGGKVCEVATEAQSLIFSKSKFNKEEAQRWARRHGFMSGDVDEKTETYHLRQEDPKDFVENSFRTTPLIDGVKMITACPKHKLGNGGRTDHEEMFKNSRTAATEHPCVMVILALNDDNEIHMDDLYDIIGGEPNYPNQYVGEVGLRKCYGKPYYKYSEN